MDQAQGLRDLVKGGAFEAMGLPSVFDAKPDTLDYRKLWQDQKADLERWRQVGGFDKPALSVESLASMWEMMQRREEQSR